MGAPGSELVDIVDIKDRVVGSATLAECLTKALLHRAVAVLVIRSDGRLLMQRRGLKDIWHPGMWTLSSTGHVRRGEAYLAGAAREMKEELGLASRLKPLSKLLLPPIRSRWMTEWEWVSLFTSETDAEVTVDPTELESVHSFTPAEVKKMLEARKLTPDAKFTLSVYFDSVSPRTKDHKD